MPQNNQNTNIRSEEVQEILEAVPNWMIRLGNLLILLMVILLLLISWFVKYPDIITAEAIITTHTPPQKEFARSSGIFQAILIEDGDTVSQNQTLAIIENTANYEDVLKLKSVIDTIQINNDYINFPFDDLPVLFLGDIESQYALFENSYIQYKLNSELQPYSNETAANKYTISELTRRLQSLISQQTINKTELEFKQKDLKRFKTLFEKGIISEQDFDNKQLEIAQAQRSFKNFESSISQVREAINNAQRTYKGTEINKTKEEMTLLKSVIQSYNQLKKAIKDWENRYVLKSNIKGKVSFLNYWNVNQTVTQGDLVFTIIPTENTSYIAKLKSPSHNSGKIKTSQKVKIRLENYPDTEFGTLNGIVENISLLPDNNGQYLIDAKLPEKLITSYNKTIDFKHEMRGSAEIITEDLRLLERFFYQLKNAINK